MEKARHNKNMAPIYAKILQYDANTSIKEFGRPLIQASADGKNA